jgi:glutamate-1-semialdehyde 2,1-aminomutase
MGRDFSRSASMFTEARRYIPGGVNSPVRAFKAVGGTPVFFARGEGVLLYDVDGNQYIDYVASWGPLILGHAPPVVIKALKECAGYGTSFGAPTEPETELARLLVAALPSVELVRLVNSGTEATMSALRLARAYTKREKIVKFEGCYHGHADALLVKAGSGALTLGVPISPGVPEDTVRNTIVADFNDLDGLKKLFARTGEEIAAVIVEPVPGNMGVVPPIPGFLEGLRELTAQYGTLLIFDEVITGFRVAYGGAQSLYNVQPDLTCLGKIIGGGLPVGAYGGRREIMELLAPSGPVYQAGTLSGNPLAVTAGIATLKALAEPGIYEELERKTARLAEGLQKAAAETGAGAEVCFTRVGSMLCAFFQPGPVTDFAGAVRSNTQRYARYFQALLERGVYIAPAQFEGMFISTAHTDEHIDQTVEMCAQAFREAFAG